jgi:hypothetical protein
MAGQVKNNNGQHHSPSRRDKERLREQQAAGQKFYKRLLRIVVVTVTLCAAGLAYLYFWLYRYEKQSVTGAMRTYISDVADGKWDDIYSVDSTYFTELNTKEDVTSYLQTTYEGVDPDGCTFSLISETDTGIRQYDVYYRSEVISTLETYKPSDSTTWKVRTLVTGGTYTFDVLDNASFSLNDNAITSSYIISEEALPLGLEELADAGYNLPSVVRYQVDNLIGDPVPVPQDSQNYIAVRDWTGSHFYIGPKPTSDQLTEFSNELEQTAIAYSQYITNDGTFYALSQHLVRGTEFYYAIVSLDNQYFSSHNSIDFQNIEITDVLPLGEDAFVGTISYDVVVTSNTTEKTYASSYQIFFVRENGSWKASNIVTLTQEDNTEQAQETAEALG